MRSAIVGCGSIAKVHAEVVAHLTKTGHQLVAFIDCSLEAAKELEKVYGSTESSVYTSLEEMIEKMPPGEKIDVLHICTPHYLHVPMAIYALEHNIHVFMEKPPAISSREYEKLQAITTEAKLGVCFQNRYNESVEAVSKLLQSETTGKMLGARAFVTWKRDENYYTESNWRGRLAAEGGGVLINQAIHTLDLLIYFLGKPEAVEATAINHHLKNIIEVEDTVEAYIRFGDITASLYATTAFCMNSPVLIEIVCENTVIRMEDTEVTYILADGSKKTLSFKASQKAGKDYWGSGHFACIQDFYNCLKKDIPSKIDINEAAKVMQLMIGIYESAQNKSVVNF